MGHLNGDILVIMTNGDVYFISREALLSLEKLIRGKDTIFYTTDMKTGYRLKIFITHISSIVDRGSDNA